MTEYKRVTIKIDPKSKMAKILSDKKKIQQNIYKIPHRAPPSVSRGN